MPENFAHALFSVLPTQAEFTAIITKHYLEYVRPQLGLLPEGLPARLADLLRRGRPLVHPLDVLVHGALKGITIM